MAIPAGIAVAGVLLATAGAAQAAPFDFDCVSTLVHSGQLRQVQLGPSYRVRGRIGPVELEDVPDPALPVLMVGNDIPNHRRTAMVTIMSAMDHSSVTLAVLPIWPGNEADSIAEVAVQFVIDGVATERTMTTIRRRGYMWGDVPFEIDVRPDRVIVEADGRREEFTLTLGPGAMTELICAGGSFAFEDIDWGPVAPGASDAEPGEPSG
jgi:hypothetical protein